MDKEPKFSTRKTIFFVILLLALIPYLGVMGASWFILNQTAVTPPSGALQFGLLILIVLGMACIGAAAFLLNKVMDNAALPQTMPKMNEQFIEAGKMASIGELAAGIAHEINNPVAIMVEEAGWMNDLLEEDEAFSNSPNLGEFKRALNQIRTQGARCREITHKMLRFARKTDLRIQEVHINPLLQEVVALSDKRARYSGCTVVLELDADLSPVAASASEMQQIFLNLINNSLDAMEDKGGTLNISTRRVGDMAEIVVADTGDGIPKANLTRIFDPFYTTKPVGKGTGLGLSICYTIIKNMGGDIMVQSQVDQGTTFTIHLPICRSGPDASPAAP
ncbi:sensor histidine kinase [Desulfonatronum parangueonense]